VCVCVCVYVHSRAELESSNEKFDVIIGDLNDPMDGGPCFTLYTQSFYMNILKPKLNFGGILVTQVISPSPIQFFSVTSVLCMARVNQHSPVHHEGWMVSGHKTIFYWVPVPSSLTMLVNSVAFLKTTYLILDHHSPLWVPPWETMLAKLNPIPSRK